MGVLLAAEDLNLLLAIALLIAVIRKRLRILLLLIILGAALFIIREAGEEVISSDSRKSFVITARSDSSKLPAKVLGDYMRNETCSFRAESRSIGGQERQIPLRVITSTCDVFFGEQLSGWGRLLPSDEKRVASMLLVDELTGRKSPALWRFLHQIRQSFRGLFAEDSEAASLVPGMVIGDESLQSDEFKAMMRLAGLSHLTAVSGANFSIVATMILWLVSRWIVKRSHRIAVTATALLVFTLLVRPSPSVLRAGVMACVVLIAQWRGDRRTGFLALAGAVLILLLLDPHQGLDAGFALSVLATSGILLLSPPLVQYFQLKLGLPRVLAEVLAIPLSATIFCTPVIIGISGKVSLASIPLNIAIAPLVPIITILGFITLLISPIPLIALPLAEMTSLAASPIPVMARWTYYLPIWEVTSGWRGGFMALALILLVLLTLRFLMRTIQEIKGSAEKSKVFLASLSILILIAAVINGERDDWQLFQCDVGQGDALLVRTGDRSAIVVDSGPDPELIDRCLRSSGVREISLLVITHLHADHYAGIPGVLRGRRVGSWWLSPVSAGSDQSLEIRSLLNKEPVTVSEGDRFEVGQVKIEVLSPEHDAMADDSNAINNASLVLLVRMEDATILITGDIGEERQEWIAKRYDLRSVNIYKVSHHGSRSRSRAFDAELNPELALISVGANNPFGHPAPETLDLLAPAQIHRTDRDGGARITWWPLRIH